MTISSVVRGTAEAYAARLLDLILDTGNSLPRSYGFEYEFLPDRILQPADLVAVRSVLLGSGFSRSGDMLVSDGRGVTFEPGGQIEFLSRPMMAADRERFYECLEWIISVREAILDETGIRYIGTDFIPGRYSAPLLLTSDRYAKMHSRFMNVDERGPDMMKGTAAVHLHAALTSVADIERLYPLFCRLAFSSEFGMSDERRAIWDATDSGRCGIPEVEENGSVLAILSGVCLAALEAVELYSGRSFIKLENTTFDEFLDHLTTMFTDVRFNLKGGTLELRTLDSMPIRDFPDKWERFLEKCGC